MKYSIVKIVNCLISSTFIVNHSHIWLIIETIMAQFLILVGLNAKITHNLSEITESYIYTLQTSCVPQFPMRPFTPTHCMLASDMAIWTLPIRLSCSSCDPFAYIFCFPNPLCYFHSPQIVVDPSTKTILLNLPPFRRHLHSRRLKHILYIVCRYSHWYCV